MIYIHVMLILGRTEECCLRVQTLVLDKMTSETIFGYVIFSLLSTIENKCFVR